MRDLPPATRRGIRFVLTDIDDTLTSGGRLTAAAYDALERLAHAGFSVVPVTGRPAGWCDLIARFWPVAAVVGENGAFYFRYDRAARRMVRRFWEDDLSRARHRAELDALGEAVIAAVPGAALAADQPYRAADIAIDYREDVGPLETADVDRIVAVLERAGVQAKVSSIHVNGWFGDHDKRAMTQLLLREVFGLGLEQQRDAVLFIGDSPNDEPMYEFFPHSVAVANIKRFLPRLVSRPAYLTEQEAGAGFVELAEALLEVKQKTTRRRKPVLVPGGEVE